jgi:hypothetical protein
MYEIICKVEFKWTQYIIVAQASSGRMTEREVFNTIDDIREQYPDSVISVVQ